MQWNDEPESSFIGTECPDHTMPHRRQIDIFLAVDHNLLIVSQLFQCCLKVSKSLFGQTHICCQSARADGCIVFPRQGGQYLFFEKFHIVSKARKRRPADEFIDKTPDYL